MLNAFETFWLGFLSEEYAVLASVLSVVGVVLLLYVVVFRGFLSIFVRDHSWFRLPDIVIGVLVIAFVLNTIPPAIRFDGLPDNTSESVPVSQISLEYNDLSYSLDMEDGYEYLAYVGSTGSTLVFVKFSDSGKCYVSGSSICLTGSYAYVYKVTSSGVSMSLLSSSSDTTVTSFLSTAPVVSTVDIYTSNDFAEVMYEKTIAR